MAEVLSIETVLLPWLAARDPRLLAKVFPMAASPPAVGPYCTFFRVSTDTYGHLKGQTGVSWARMQLDFWSQDHAEARSIADKIAGDKEDPGLRGFRGLMGGVNVQVALRVDESDDYEDPDDGTELGWYRVRADYKIVWNERTG